MTPNEARRGEGMPDADGGDTVYQAVNMAPLGWVPSDRGAAGGAGSDQTGVPGAGGDGDPLRDPAGDAAPGA